MQGIVRDSGALLFRPFLGAEVVSQGQDHWDKGSLPVKGEGVGSSRLQGGHACREDQPPHPVESKQEFSTQPPNLG